MKAAASTVQPMRTLRRPTSEKVNGRAVCADDTAANWVLSKTSRNLGLP